MGKRFDSRLPETEEGQTLLAFGSIMMMLSFAVVFIDWRVGVGMLMVVPALMLIHCFQTHYCWNIWVYFVGTAFPYKQVRRGDHFFVRDDPQREERAEWLRNSIPWWAYCNGNDALIFLRKQDAALYKLAWHGI